MEYLIKNAKIIDGTSAPWFHGDVYISDGKIKKVGKIKDTTNGTVIDATGLYLAPGFIDAHSHADLDAAFKKHADAKPLQGCTTEVAGMCGTTPIPMTGFKEEILTDMYGNLEAYRNMAKEWETFSDWAAFMTDHKHSTDLVVLVGHGAIRASVMGYENRPPTKKEQAQMNQLLDQCLSEGAMGMSSGLIYPPGVFSGLDEMIELGKVLAAHGKIYTTHMRNEGSHVLDSIKESITVAETSGCRLHISHLKVTGKENHGSMQEALRLMEEGRNRGVSITCDVYPYLASSTSLISILPNWVHEGGVKKLLERLHDKETREKIAIETIDGLKTFGELEKDKAWGNLLISESPSHPHFSGRDVFDIATAEEKEPVDIVLDTIVADNARTRMVRFSMDEKDNHLAYQHPLTSVGSDSSNGFFIPRKEDGCPHPRGFGTFPKVIGEFAREKGLFSVEEAIFKMTGMPANIYNLQDRGLIKEGLLGDIVLFDYKTIIDNATFKNPFAPPTGIVNVFKNGEMIVENGNYLQKDLGIVYKG